MVERSLGEPPFGRLRLPPSVEYFRAVANKIEDGTLSRRFMSIARWLCLVGRPDPIDIEVFHGGRVRLYPRSNRCERRVFLGVNSWELRERAIVVQQMANAPQDRPFVFVDGGANVGLYSLYVVGEARRLRRDSKIIAVEPDPQNLSRLRYNLQASEAREVTVAPFALGEEAGQSMLLSDQPNRGEVRLARNDREAEQGIPVELKPLAAILADAGVDHVDVLKLDIEGAELPVLRGFFAQTPRSLWPRLITLEIGKYSRESEAMTLCIDVGYELTDIIHVNAILHLAASDGAPGIEANHGNR